MAKYNMTFEEAQEYISKRGFDIAWNDCDVFIDVRHITQAIGNILKWADEHPKEEPVSDDLEKVSKEWLRPQLDKSYANYGEAKMMELTHFDGYAMLEAIEFGAKWKEEQMMKQAIEGVAMPDDCEVWCNLDSFNLKEGDKIKVIVIKED